MSRSQWGVIAIDTDLFIRWIYALFLAIDANFRLRRKIVSSDKVDPGLSDGWAFFVEEKEYKKHLALHWDQKQEVRI